MTLKPFDKNKEFSTDGETIYYQNYGMKTPKPIPEVDYQTFEVHSYYLASDKNRVYAISQYVNRKVSCRCGPTCNFQAFFILHFAYGLGGFIKALT